MVGMVEPISAEEFRRAEGVEDWHAAGAEASATFRTASFATGVALINRIAEMAEEADHHPDVDLRYATLTVRLTTHATGSLTQRDVDLARRITLAARDLGVA